MEISDIKAKLTEIIEPYVEEKELLKDVSGETDFMRDLKINSAHLVDIILDVEEAFNIEIDDETAEEMLTVQAAVDVISSRVEAKNA